MNNIKDSILKAREERWNNIQEKITDSNVVVSLKANIPGDNKQNSLAYLIIQVAKSEIHFENQSQCLFYDGSDGPYYLYIIENEDGNEIKKQTIKIEQQSEIGRLYDIDVFSFGKKHDRINKRKCIICDNMAFDCSREKKHDIDDLLSKIISIVKNKMSEILRQLLKNAFLTELNLDPKFGLVTPYSNGSHKDMNYIMMKKSIEVILPFLIEIFDYSYGKQTLEERVLICREVGKIAEREMLKETGNVNTYKGLIYNLGLILISISDGFSGAYPNFDVLNNVIKIVEILNFYNNDKTVYNNHVENLNVKNIGVKFEAINGYPTVRDTLRLIKDKTQINLLHALVYIIQHTGDSVLLKRSKTMEKYEYNISKFNNIDLNDLSEIESLTDYFIENNVSFGGSADLLVVSLFLESYFSVFSFFESKNHQLKSDV